MSTTPARRPLTVAFIDRVHGDPTWVLDALRRNYDVRVDADAPEVVICGDNRESGRLRYPDALKIWIQHENHYADFSKYHYVIGYRHVDHPRWFREPLYTRTCTAQDLVKDADFVERTVREKTKFCTMVASYANAVRVWRRFKLCDLLDAYKPIDYGGRWRNNIGGPVKDKLPFYRPYKFAVAFDNNSMSGYTTEKPTDAFMTGCIPIYLGNPDIAGEFNPKSFINGYEFRTIEDIVARVIELDRDERQYRQMLAEPWFHGNRPNQVFDPAPLAEFLRRAIESPRPPLYPVYLPYRIYDWTRKFGFYFDWLMGEKLGVPVWGPT